MTIDRAAFEAMIAENFAGEWDIFRETAVCFLDALEGNIKEFRQAFSTQDPEAMVRTSHRIKGEASLFHRPVVHGYFKEIEANARKGVLPSQQAFDEAEQGIRGLGQELRLVLTEEEKRSA